MGAYEHYLSHHGIKGQKWGERRYQNEDGTLTDEGRSHYRIGEGRPEGHGTATIPAGNHRQRLEEKYRQSGMNSESAKIAAQRRIKTEKVVAAAGAVTLLAAGVYVKQKRLEAKAKHGKRGGYISKLLNGSGRKISVKSITNAKPSKESAMLKKNAKRMALLSGAYVAFKYGNVARKYIDADTKRRAQQIKQSSKR